MLLGSRWKCKSQLTNTIGNLSVGEWQKVNVILKWIQCTSPKKDTRRSRTRKPEREKEKIRERERMRSLCTRMPLNIIRGDLICVRERSKLHITEIRFDEMRQSHLHLSRSLESIQVIDINRYNCTVCYIQQSSSLFSFSFSHCYSHCYCNVKVSSLQTNQLAMRRYFLADEQLVMWVVFFSLSLLNWNKDEQEFAVRQQW